MKDSLMVIRTAQWSHLEQQSVQRFESDLLILLREEFPSRCAQRTDDDLLRQIRLNAARCREAYAISEEDAATKFVYLTWLLGQDFEARPQHAWIRDILSHERPGSERMEIIMSGVIYHLDNNTGSLRLAEVPNGYETSQS
jgi:hypothetical protein